MSGKIWNVFILSCFLLVAVKDVFSQVRGGAARQASQRAVQEQAISNGQLGGQITGQNQSKILAQQTGKRGKVAKKKVKGQGTAVSGSESVFQMNTLAARRGNIINAAQVDELQSGYKLRNPAKLTLPDANTGPGGNTGVDKGFTPSGSDTKQEQNEGTGNISYNRSIVDYEIESTQQKITKLGSILEKHGNEEYYTKVKGKDKIEHWEGVNIGNASSESFFGSQDLADNAETGFRKMVEDICATKDMHVLIAGINSLSGHVTGESYRKKESVELTSKLTPELTYLFPGESKVTIDSLIEKYGHLEEALKQAKLFSLPTENLQKQMESMFSVLSEHFKTFVEGKNKSGFGNLNYDNVYLNVQLLEKELNSEREHFENLQNVHGIEEKEYPKDYHPVLVSLDHLVQTLPKTSAEFDHRNDDKAKGICSASREILDSLVVTGNYESLKFALDNTTTYQKDPTKKPLPPTHRDIILNHPYNGSTIKALQEEIESLDQNSPKRKEAISELGKAMQDYASKNKGNDGWHMIISEDTRNGFNVLGNSHESINQAGKAATINNKGQASGTSTESSAGVAPAL